jgi:hypothetical protein
MGLFIFVSSSVQKLEPKNLIFLGSPYDKMGYVKAMASNRTYEDDINIKNKYDVDISSTVHYT